MCAGGPRGRALEKWGHWREARRAWGRAGEDLVLRLCFQVVVSPLRRIAVHARSR